MKTILISIQLALFFTVLHAQKHDHNWLIGYGDFTTDIPNADGLLINFNNQDVHSSIFKKDRVFSLTSLSYSDEEGQLQFYSEGCSIFDENGEVFENGERINEDSYCDPKNNSGYYIDQGMIALPTSDKDISALFYEEGYVVEDTTELSFIRIKLKRALIDVNDKVVLTKNEVILDNLDGNILSATKHSNGQDWWLMTLKFGTNDYHCLHISEGEVIDTVRSVLGTRVFAAGAQQTNFSPNGKMFARYSPSDELQLFDFDRSTGRLNNLRLIDVPGTLEGTLHTGGLSFSGSSRFLYVNDALGIWQYDTQSNDIEASIVLVAEREAFYTGEDIFGFRIWTFFYRMGLAPDCRIYMSSRSGVDRMYVIMEPDVKGVECNVVQNIELPIWNLGTIPQYPNYRLDRAPFCDASKTFPANLELPTSTTELNVNQVGDIYVYPNPATDYIKINKKGSTYKEFKFFLYDLLGKVKLSKTLHHDVSNIRLDQIEVPSGIYIYTIVHEGKILTSDKIVVN